MGSKALRAARGSLLVTNGAGGFYYPEVRMTRTSAVFRDDAAAEGEQRQQRQLHVLQRERDADEADGEADGEADVREEDPYAGDEAPQHVHDDAEDAGAGGRRIVDDVLAEREQRQAGDLEALHAERDPDDGEAQDRPT